MQLFKDLRQRGVAVRILTNSLESADMLVAQSGYMPYRLPLLENGVELYEIRSLLGNARGSGQTAAISRHGNYSLHAKLFVFDRQRLFIGSMNFDQRSMHLKLDHRQPHPCPTGCRPLRSHGAAGQFLPPGLASG